MNAIFSQTFYDSHAQKYQNIYVIDEKPSGPLENIVKKIQSPKLSQFKTNDSCSKSCVYAIYNPHNPQELLCLEDISILFNFLLSNNYTIETLLTHMMNQSKVEFKKNFVCFIKYTAM
tara:strand:+ start:1007 stop:1360 length:354 start_codon:yes stop_codon:yes gene_type:complete